MSTTIGSATTFEVNGVQYSATKMNVFHQFHVLRKLGPLIAKLGPSFMEMKPRTVTNEDGSTTVSMAGIDLSDVAFMAPALEALAEMTEEDCNYVIERCLACARRQEISGAWVPVWNERAKRLQYEDTDFMTTMQIVVQVLSASLMGFSQGVGQNTAEPPPNTSGLSPSLQLPMVRISS